MKNHNNICRHCHKTDIPLILEVITKWAKYYTCRSCNTKKAQKYRATPNGALRMRLAVNKSIKKFPQKQKARQLLCWHVRQGNIIRPEYCSNCGEKTKVAGHHKDYSKPLEVTWLCKNCHCVV